jgi:DNA invertase Pin-like site-specific DNA recombinase
MTPGDPFPVAHKGIVATFLMGTDMRPVTSAFARLERDQLAKRTRAEMASAAANGRLAGRWEITAEQGSVKRAREHKAQGTKPSDIGKALGVSGATVYWYLGLGGNDFLGVTAQAMVAALVGINL